VRSWSGISWVEQQVALYARSAVSMQRKIRSYTLTLNPESSINAAFTSSAHDKSINIASRSLND